MGRREIITGRHGMITGGREINIVRTKEDYGEDRAIVK